MNLMTAIREIYEKVPDMQLNDRWMVLSKDGGRHCAVSNEEHPEKVGYRNKDLLFVYQHTDAESAELIFEGRV